MIKKLLLSFAILATPIAAQAAGFALIEQSASCIGNACAGAAAIAEDASTIFFNPAGMTYIQGTQFVGAMHLIKPNAEFNGTISATGKAGGNGGDAGDLAFAPNMYFETSLNETVKLGIGVNSPFGLKTEYDPTWKGRFQSIKSEFKTININPAIAIKVNDQLSLGAGISAMRAQAELTSAANTVGDPLVRVKGSDWGFGFNLGAIYQATANTRVGIAYRSKVKQHLTGTSQSAFTALNGIPSRTFNTDVMADVTLPESFSVSAFSKVNDQFDVMGDVTWTRWSQFDKLEVVRTNGSILSSTPENWSNSLRYAIGANYHYNEAIKLRAGLAYDEEAMSDQYRTARIPGNDRKWLSFGANWKVTPSSSLDFAYAHLFISNASIDDNRIANLKGEGRLTGTYEGDVNILSAQYNHTF